jgi:hypothetical protein
MDKNPPDMYNHIKAHLDENESPIYRWMYCWGNQKPSTIHHGIPACESFPNIERIFAGMIYPFKPPPCQEGRFLAHSVEVVLPLFHLRRIWAEVGVGEGLWPHRYEACTPNAGKQRIVPQAALQQGHRQ